MSSSIQHTTMSRVSMMMTTDLLMNNVRNNHSSLMAVQSALSSGLKLARPSDAPSQSTMIMHLDKQLEQYQQFQSNISYATDFMSTTDTAVGEAITLARDAHTQVMEALDVTWEDNDFSSYVTIVDGIINQLVTTANRTCHDSYIFGGQKTDSAPCSMAYSGVQFAGSRDAVQTRTSSQSLTEINVDPQDVFGMLSREMLGIADVNPAITGETLLSDLNGANGLGIRKGTIQITDGVDTVRIDVSDCVTLADLRDKINTEAAGIGVSVQAYGPPHLDHLVLNSPGWIEITDVGTAQTASDLGIEGTFTTTLNGQDIDARLTKATSVAALANGAGIDLASGLRVTNTLIETDRVIDLSTAQTMGDILNTITHAGMAMRAEINEDGSGINILNELSGSAIMIGENGGTTAEDLGIRTLHAATKLADLNGGDGVLHPDQGGAILITDRAGTNYTVDLSACATVNDVIAAINATAGATVNAALTATGNGIELTDTSGGGGAFSVTDASSNGYTIADRLGLEQSVAGNVLTGEDVNPIEPDGLFAHLIELKTAFQQGDRHAVETMGRALEDDIDQLIHTQGRVGALMQGLTAQQEHLEDTILATETLRSDIRDVDFTEAITQYQSLYTALQATLMSGSDLNSVSLLDFLR